MTKINSRSKGHRGEREIVRLLKKYNIITTRNLQQTAEGGYDIKTEGTVLEPYAIEVKNLGKWSISVRNQHWKQAVEQANKKGKIPLLVWKINYGVWFIEYLENKQMNIEYFEEWLIRGKFTLSHL